MDTCYANALGDCGDKISAEHYISRAILEFAQPDIGRILLGGPAGKPKPKGAPNLANKRMLCTKHNSELSAIDTEMAQLIAAVFEWNNKPSNTELSLDGGLLTRWLMKFGAGSVVAKTTNGNPVADLFSKDWLEVLFGRCDLPDWAGVSVSGPTRMFPPKVMENGGVPPYVVAPLVTEDASILGAEIGIYPIELFTFFQLNDAVNSGMFRLGEVCLEREDSGLSMKIHLNWPDERNTCMKIICN